MDILNNDNIPVGLALAFTQNIRAMNQFYNMTEKEKEQLINRAKALKSDQEMQSLLQSMDMDRFS